MVSGILLLLVAVLTAGAVTYRSAVLVAAFTLVAGAIQFVHGAHRREEVDPVSVASGAVYVIVGAVVVTHTAENRLALALLASLFLAAQGIVRMVPIAQGSGSSPMLLHTVVSLGLAFITAVWALQHLVVSIMLGALTWKIWPLPDLRGVGLFIVIDMLLCGAELIVSRRPSRWSAA